MKTQVMINNGEKYCGRYVATKSFKHKTVVAWGKSFASAHSKAKKKGIKNPVVFYIPQKNMVHIY